MQLAPSNLTDGLLKTAIALGLAPMAALAPSTSSAEAAPTEGYIGFRVLNYHDSQPNLERMTVRANAVSWLIPAGEQWSVEGSWVQDAISGASPAYHSAAASAKSIVDQRTALDLRLTRYLLDGSVSLGAAYSDEADYTSRAISLLVSKQPASKNTTLNVGLGHIADVINPTNRVVVDARKQTHEFMLGVTQVLTPTDIVQVNLSRSLGQGYFSDPYKMLDHRPDARRSTALLARWNHHFEDLQASLRLSYRAYRDSFDIRSSTWTMEWAQQLPNDWTITPLYRAYRQSAASFYVPEDPQAPDRFNLPPGAIPGVSLLSLDQRLSAFKANTWGLKLAKKFDQRWTVEARLESYRQRGQETPFDAVFSQVAAVRRF